MKFTEMNLILDAIVKQNLLDYIQASLDNDQDTMDEIRNWFKDEKVIKWMEFYYKESIDVDKLLQLCCEKNIKEVID